MQFEIFGTGSFPSSQAALVIYCINFANSGFSLFLLSLQPNEQNKTCCQLFQDFFFQNGRHICDLLLGLTPKLTRNIDWRAQITKIKNSTQNFLLGYVKKMSVAQKVTEIQPFEFYGYIYFLPLSKGVVQKKYAHFFI